MYKIFLINMPFADLGLPSIALTQLKSIADGKFANQAEVSIFYLNHDFAHYMGTDSYQDIATSMKHHITGLGDWFFRQAAFPTLADNTETYFLRYYPHQDKESQAFKQLIQEKRAGLDHFFDTLILKYRLDQAELVGFTSMFCQNAACFALARKLKALNSEITIVMGGANCEAPMGQEIVRNVEQVDAVFSGPALISFPEFVDYKLNHRFKKLSRIDGVFTKENLDFLQSPAAPCEEISLESSPTVATLGQELDIDTQIDLDYDEFLDSIEENFPDRKSEVSLTFETSRGCWWGERAQCTFCGLNGLTMNYRFMRPKNAIEQFNKLFAYARRIPKIKLQSVDNILPKTYLQEVLPFLDTPSNTTIFYEVRATLIEEDIKTLSKARVKIIQPGIEALATSSLKLMNKGSTSFINLNLLKNCAMYDVFPGWNLLVGFPGEREGVYKKYLQDIPLFMHLPPPSGAFPVRFDRYSPYFTRFKEYGLDLHPVDFYQLIYSFDKQTLANLAYYFMDHNFEADYFVEMVQWIGKINEKIELWQARWPREDPHRRASLFFHQKNGSTFIHDSRSGEVIEYAISETSKQMLDRLNNPTDLKKLVSGLRQTLGDFDTEKEIAFLEDRGLVFEESGRYMNLVLHHRAPTDLAERGKVG